MWVGISDKENLEPLSCQSLSGEVIAEIESRFNNIKSHKTNLVNYAPMDAQGKMRYPNQAEITDRFPAFRKELDLLKPRVVFMLGKLVSENIGKRLDLNLSYWDKFNYTPFFRNGTYFVPVHHPSYIAVYKKKDKDICIERISGIINVVITFAHVDQNLVNQK